VPKKKWFSNDGLDRAIRAIYERRNGNNKLPGLKELAARIGRPKWTLTKRARELGLSRTKEAPWSERELVLLEQWAWMCDARIALKLRAAGFRRTATAVHLKLRRMRYKQSIDYYSGRGLAQAFGVDEHCITRWINLGMLQAQKRGTLRTSLQGGDTWLIFERDVWRFIGANPNEFDLRKVDQTWFMDMVLANTKKGGEHDGRAGESA
jgi:hypothetical protein